MPPYGCHNQNVLRRKLSLFSVVATIAFFPCLHLMAVDPLFITLSVIDQATNHKTFYRYYVFQTTEIGFAFTI